jgi:hypothetical protein
MLRKSADLRANVDEDSRGRVAIRLCSIRATSQGGNAGFSFEQSVFVLLLPLSRRVNSGRSIIIDRSISRERPSSAITFARARARFGITVRERGIINEEQIGPDRKGEKVSGSEKRN